MPAKSARRDVLRELAHLVRVVEGEGNNLGPFLAAHAGELAPRLSTTANDLEASCGLTDEQVMARLRTRLERACRRDDEERLRRRAEDAQGAAARLAESVRWVDGKAVLPLPLLLSRQLWSVTWNGVLVADGFEVVVRREAIVQGRAVLLKLPTCEAYCDAGGLHFRWGQRGRLNLNPRPLDRDDRARALVIALPLPVEARSPRVGLPVLLGDVIAGLGFA